MISQGPALVRGAPGHPPAPRRRPTGRRGRARDGRTRAAALQQRHGGEFGVGICDAGHLGLRLALGECWLLRIAYTNLVVFFPGIPRVVTSS